MSVSAVRRKEGSVMLMPTLSVTVIGVVVAPLAMARGARPGVALVRGVVGAWLGFLAGAIPGVLIDVATSSGWYVAVPGHAGALAGASVGLRRFGLPRPAGGHPR